MTYDRRATSTVTTLFGAKAAWALKLADSVANGIADYSGFRDAHDLRFALRSDPDGSALDIEAESWGAHIQFDVTANLVVNISVWPSKRGQAPIGPDDDLTELLSGPDKTVKTSVKFKDNDSYLKVRDEIARAFVRTATK
jgi:hypothetical protein